MIWDSLKIFSLYTEPLLVLGLTIAGTWFLVRFFAKEFSKKLRTGVFSLLLIPIIINLATFSIIAFGIFRVFQVNIKGFESIIFFFTLVYTIILNFNLILRMKTLLPKGKRRGNTYDLFKDEIYADRWRFLSLFITSFLIFAPMYILGNGSINGLLTLLLSSVLVCSLSSIFLLPKLLSTIKKFFG